jgi:hypothetical protein
MLLGGRKSARMLKKPAREYRKEPKHLPQEDYQCSLQVWKKLAEEHGAGSASQEFALNMVRILQEKIDGWKSER